MRQQGEKSGAIGSKIGAGVDKKGFRDGEESPMEQRYNSLFCKRRDHCND